MSADASKIMTALRTFGFGGVLLVALLAINVVLTPGRFTPSGWGILLGIAAPLIGAAMASTPAVLAGRGGVDVSVGPLMGLCNAVVVVVLGQRLGLTSPIFVVPAVIGIGIIVGAANGLFAAIVRIQPIIATLGTYLVINGITLTILPSPVGGVPDWLRLFSQQLSWLPPLAILAIWGLARRLPYYDLLMATGSDDRAAFTAGVNVSAVRFVAYVLTGIFAGIASLSLTALIGSADPSVGPSYTLLAISAVALGGVSLAGGRGGPVGAAIGALDIFLLQNALTYFNVSTFVLQVAYGVVLVAAVASIAIQDRTLAARASR
jgi:ribose transport system permease protein